jgi:hypothetical protein
MAAPPLPNSPAMNPNASTPSTPQTPAGAQNQPSGPEQQRIALLLSINTQLLQESQKLQSEGKGGATNAQQATQMQAAGQPAALASPEYIDVLRHIQANLAYLMPSAQGGDKSKVPKGPQFMAPPQHMQSGPQYEELRTQYEELKRLFPDWTGYDARAAMQQAPQASASPNPAAMVNGPGGQQSQPFG